MAEMIIQEALRMGAAMLISIAFIEFVEVKL